VRTPRDALQCRVEQYHSLTLLLADERRPGE
jgi:hypothetical protein